MKPFFFIAKQRRFSSIADMFRLIAAAVSLAAILALNSCCCLF